MAAVGVIALDGLRDAAAAALAPASETDPPVHVDILDSYTPPALALDWDDPWLEPGVGVPTMGPCILTARLAVKCVAGRLEPGPGYDELDRLVSHVLDRMRADASQWALERVSGPVPEVQSGISYLSCVAVYTITTTT